LFKVFCKMILKNRKEICVFFTQIYFQLFAKHIFNVTKYFRHKPQPSLGSYSRRHMQRVMQLSAVNYALNSFDAKLGIVTSFAKQGDQPSKSTEFWEFTD
jgi:hypothetical protein